MLFHPPPRNTTIATLPLDTVSCKHLHCHPRPSYLNTTILIPSYSLSTETDNTLHVRSRCQAHKPRWPWRIAWPRHDHQAGGAQRRCGRCQTPQLVLSGLPYNQTYRLTRYEHHTLSTPHGNTRAGIPIETSVYINTATQQHISTAAHQDSSNTSTHQNSNTSTHQNNQPTTQPHDHTTGIKPETRTKRDGQIDAEA